MAQMLTIPEVVKLLRVPETTIRRWIQQGEFPCSIRNGKPLINKTTLISWAEAKHLRLGSSALGKKGNLVSDNLLAALELGGIHYGLEGEDREAVIRRIPGQLQLNNISPQKLETLLLERESQSSTATHFIHGQSDRAKETLCCENSCNAFFSKVSTQILPLA